MKTVETRTRMPFSDTFGTYFNNIFVSGQNGGNTVTIEFREGSCNMNHYINFKEGHKAYLAIGSEEQYDRDKRVKSHIVSFHNYLYGCNNIWQVRSDVSTYNLTEEQKKDHAMRFPQEGCFNCNMLCNKEYMHVAKKENHELLVCSPCYSNDAYDKLVGYTVTEIGDRYPNYKLENLFKKAEWAR